MQNHKRPISESNILTIKIWEFFMKLGNFCGCHQKPERSFFVKGYQFPICARCFGLFLGYIAAVVFARNFSPHFLLCILFVLIMFFDWLLQYLKILNSNNIRRIITGFLCGYGLIGIMIKIIGELLHG